MFAIFRDLALGILSQCNFRYLNYYLVSKRGEPLVRLIILSESIMKPELRNVYQLVRSPFISFKPIRNFHGVFTICDFSYCLSFHQTMHVFITDRCKAHFHFLNCFNTISLLKTYLFVPSRRSSPNHPKLFVLLA